MKQYVCNAVACLYLESKHNEYFLHGEKGK